MRLARLLLMLVPLAADPALVAVDLPSPTVPAPPRDQADTARYLAEFMPRAGWLLWEDRDIAAVIHEHMPVAPTDRTAVDLRVQALMRPAPGRWPDRRLAEALVASRAKVRILAAMRDAGLEWDWRRRLLDQALGDWSHDLAWTPDERMQVAAPLYNHLSGFWHDQAATMLTLYLAGMRSAGIPAEDWRARLAAAGWVVPDEAYAYAKDRYLPNTAIVWDWSK